MISCLFMPFIFFEKTYSKQNIFELFIEGHTHRNHLEVAQYILNRQQVFLA
jgi:hypothetical protein